MEYFLAFDKGQASNDSNRYIVIPNNFVHSSLATNNNLKALCSFTSKFDDENDLKDIIIRLNPQFSSFKNYGLVILWKRNNEIRDAIKCNSVPYKDSTYFFNFENLVSFITNNIYSPFFNDFLDFYRNYNFLSREMNALNRAVLEKETYSVLKRLVRNFLHRLLYRKGVIDFSTLYKIAMFVYQYKDMNGQVLEIFSDECLLDDEVPLNFLEDPKLIETEEFEREWLNRRVRLRQLGLW